MNSRLQVGRGIFAEARQIGLFNNNPVKIEQLHARPYTSLPIRSRRNFVYSNSDDPQQSRTLVSAAKNLSKMSGCVLNIERTTKENENFRQVMYTTERSQLVVMTLQPGEEIGSETHPDRDQFTRIELGEGKAILNGKEHQIKEDWAVVIPAGTEHNIINTSSTQKLKLYLLYSPPEHPDGEVHKTKDEADRVEGSEKHERSRGR